MFALFVLLLVVIGIAGLALAAMLVVGLVSDAVRLFKSRESNSNFVASKALRHGLPYMRFEK